MGAAPHLLQTARSNDFADEPAVHPHKALHHRLGGAREALLANAMLAYCRIVAATFPSRLWYSISLRSAGAMFRMGRFFSFVRSSDGMEISHVARLLHRFLDIFSRLGKFPIPLTVEGEELLRSYAADPAGFICCSAHLPFVKTFFPIARTAIAESRERWVISRTPEKDNIVEIWNDEPWKAIFADNAVLLKVRAALRRNACLVAIIDKDQGDVVSSNIFRFAGKVNVKVLTWFAQLQEDGTILLRISQPPRPQCKTEEDIAANRQFVEENVERILRGDSAEARRAAEARAVEAESLRDQHRVQLYTTPQLRQRIQKLEILLSSEQYTLANRFPAEQRLAMLESELRQRVPVE